jgi:chromosome segregation ATPase
MSKRFPFSRKGVIVDIEAAYNRQSTKIEHLEAKLKAAAEKLAKKTERMGEQHEFVLTMQKQLSELRESLNLVTENKWTAMELDAAKWRAQEMAKALHLT